MSEISYSALNVQWHVRDKREEAVHPRFAINRKVMQQDISVDCFFNAVILIHTFFVKRDFLFRIFAGRHVSVINFIYAETHRININIFVQIQLTNLQFIWYVKWLRKLLYWANANLSEGRQLFPTIVLLQLVYFTLKKRKRERERERKCCYNNIIK